MPPSPPQGPRRFAAPDGTAWEARVVSAGRTSPYLAPRLTRPVVEFRAVASPALPVRYAPLAGPTLAALSAEGLLALWRRSRPY